MLHELYYVQRNFPPGRGTVERRGVLLQTAHGLLRLGLHRHPPVRVARDHDHRSYQDFDRPLLFRRLQDILPVAGRSLQPQRAYRVLQLQNNFSAGEPDPATS